MNGHRVFRGGGPIQKAAANEVGRIHNLPRKQRWAEMVSLVCALAEEIECLQRDSEPVGPINIDQEVAMTPPDKITWGGWYPGEEP